MQIRPRRSMLFFALLTIAMVAASYVFVLALAAACAYLPYLALAHEESPNIQLVLLFLFGLVVAAALVWSILPRFHRFAAPGLLLERDAQPRLFAEIERIAAALDEPMPREVYLVGDVNAGVADRGGFLGFGSRRIMLLGLPLFSVLTVAEFRAVLAHEFAHYYGGDTRLGPWVHKTTAAMGRIAANIGSLGSLARIAILGMMYVVVATLLKAYFRLFFRAINLASRRQEYRADELACLVAGRRALVDGLRAIHGAPPAWEAFWHTEVTPVLASGMVPGLVEGFSRFAAVPGIGEQIRQNVDASIEREEASPYATHPPLRDRIAAAERLPEGPPGGDDPTPARALLDAAPALEIRFLESVNPALPPGSLTTIRWEDVAGRVTLPRWRAFATQYASALEGVTAGSLPEQVPRLRDVGRQIPDPEGTILDPAQRAQRAGYLFGVGLALALLDRGWTLVEEPGVFYLGFGEQRLNPLLAVEELRTGQLSADDWRLRCAALGIGEVELSRRGPS